MTTRSQDLARALIRNVDEVPLEHQQRPPLYDTMAGRLAPGTAASKLGAAIDTVAPGHRSCPYHFHQILFDVVQRKDDLDYRDGEP